MLVPERLVLETPCTVPVNVFSTRAELTSGTAELSVGNFEQEEINTAVETAASIANTFFITESSMFNSN